MRVPVVVSTGLIAALVVVPTATSSVQASAASPAPVAAPAAAAAVTEGVTAHYEMNEGPGATVMHDSSGNGLDAVVHPPTAGEPNNGVRTGVTYAGATAYDWPRRPPAVLPVESNRIIQVPDDPAIEPGSQDFTVEIRYRTPENFGNIIQKGQATARGGQWKIQNPQGRPSCLFQGTTPTGADPDDYQVATRSPEELNDNQWHVLTCTLTQSGVRMYVDGDEVNRKNGAIGVLDNRVAMTVGGKVNCDQQDTTCDYFSGQIDYIKITKGPGANAQPTASFTRTCVGLDCTFDSSASSDPDGGDLTYAWDFGDGDTSTAANPSHTYDAGGTYKVELRVTDESGGSDLAARTFTVVDESVPSKPVNVGAAPLNASARVTWSPPTSAGGSPIDAYRVTSAPGGKTCSTAGGLTCVVTGLTVGTSYTFQIEAHNDAGWGPASNATAAVEPWGAPSAPGSVTATPGTQRVRVDWTAAQANGKPVTGYVVTPSGGGASVTVGPDARTALVTGLTKGQRYRFTVEAKSEAGRGAPRTSSWVVPAGTPYKPRSVEAAARKDAALVTWRAPKPSGAPTLRYRVQASSGKVVVVQAGSLRVVVPKLTSGKKYAFRVAAVNRVGVGAWSAWTPKVRVR